MNLERKMCELGNIHTNMEELLFELTTHQGNHMQQAEIIRRLNELEEFKGEVTNEILSAYS